MLLSDRNPFAAFLTPSPLTQLVYPSLRWSSWALQNNRSVFPSARVPSQQRRRRHLRCSASPPAAPLPKTAVKYIDPVTQSTIYVVGCVHGSFISAVRNPDKPTEDVKTVLTTASPDAIVLELCESRLKTLQKAIGNMTQTSPRLSTSLHGRRQRTFAQVAKSFRGVPQAILAVLLDTVYKLQVVSGLDPGVEFIHPIRDYSARLVCGDAPARDTVHALYRVFITPIASLRFFGTGLRTLATRIISPPANGVNLGAVILLDGRRSRELFKLVMVASLVALVVLVVGSATALAIDGTSVVNLLSSDAAASTAPPTLMDAWSPLEAGAHLAGLTYTVTTMVHFLKVLIADRDAIIAKNIVETLQTQVALHERPVSICAVVGLLHVNGILETLQTSREPPS